MTVQEFYDYCKEHGYFDYQMTTYDFDGYEEEVLFEPYNEFYTPAVKVCGTELLIGRN